MGIIFKQVDEIYRKLKTQTRRVCKDNEIARYAPDGSIEAVYTITKNGKEILKWKVGNTYAVIPGRGRPGVRLGNDQYERECLVYVDRCKSAHSDLTVWEIAKTDKFIATGKPDPEMFLLNDGLYPFRVKILEIWREPVQEISEEDAKAEGVKGTSINGEPMNPVFMYQKLWKSINKRKGTRWEDNPMVWAIRFEFAKKVYI